MWRKNRSSYIHLFSFHLQKHISIFYFHIGFSLCVMVIVFGLWNCNLFFLWTRWEMRAQQCTVLKLLLRRSKNDERITIYSMLFVCVMCFSVWIEIFPRHLPLWWQNIPFIYMPTSTVKQITVTEWMNEWTNERLTSSHQPVTGPFDFIERFVGQTLHRELQMLMHRLDMHFDPFISFTNVQEMMFAQNVCVSMSAYVCPLLLINDMNTR